MLYVVILHDDYGNSKTSTVRLVNAKDKTRAIHLATRGGSHAWGIGLTSVEVHSILYPEYLTEETDGTS